METLQDSDGVASVTDSEDEEQKAKDLVREEIFMFTGIQKCINPYGLSHKKKLKHLLKGIGSIHVLLFF